MVNVEIICFGNELLIGKTVNTNAHWLGKRLIMLGANLQRITTVSDKKDAMITVLKEVINRKPDVIITTGGLGTTFDDLSLAAIATAVNKELVYNQKAEELIKERLAFIKKTRDVEIKYNEQRKSMAMLPKDSIPLKNREGSAPGVLVEINEIKIFSLPGVPREMKAIFDYELIKYFPVNENQKFYEKSILINYIPEAELANSITEIREKYPNIYFKTHPGSSSTSKSGIIGVEIHITAIGSKEDEEKLITAYDEIIKKVEGLVGQKGKKAKITIVKN